MKINCAPLTQVQFYTVGNVDRYIARYIGLHSIDTRSTLGRHSVD